LVGTAAAFPLFFRDRTKPINQLPFSPSAKFPKSGSSCESRVSARLGADVDRCSFIAVDLHHLLFAGFDRRTKNRDAARANPAAASRAGRHGDEKGGPREGSHSNFRFEAR
jgi:hypothetical protein